MRAGLIWLILGLALIAGSLILTSIANAERLEALRLAGLWLFIASMACELVGASVVARAALARRRRAALPERAA